MIFFVIWQWNQTEVTQLADVRMRNIYDVSKRQMAARETFPATIHALLSGNNTPVLSSLTL